MTADRFYSLLLRVYPTTFRLEYGAVMLDAFRQLRAAYSGSPVAFWLFVVSDVGRSACSAHFDECRTEPRRFSLEWTVACTCGAVVIALSANLLTAAFTYLYHPYLEGLTFLPWTYGALLGVGLGSTQTAVLHRRFRPGILWVVGTALATAIGFEAAIATATIAGPIGYGIVLGGIVGGSQWCVLRTRVRRPFRSTLISMFALLIAIAGSAVSIRTLLGGLSALPPDTLGASTEASRTALNFLTRGLYGPTTSRDLAIECAVMATCGLVIAKLTANPLSVIHAGQEQP